MVAILYKTQTGNIKLENYKLLSFDKIPSTQDAAHDLIADHKASNKTVIVAQTQTNGRGRYNRNWISKPGNLYASFIYKNPERDPKLSYAVAVAVADTLITFGLNPQIKWPNDILINDEKISGILIEYSASFVIIGIGINIKHCPQNLNYKTTKMCNCSDASVQDVLAVLIKKLDKWRNADFAIVRERWMDMAIGINETVTYQGKTATLIGLNENGALVLRCGTNYLLIYGDEINM